MDEDEWEEVKELEKRFHEKKRKIEEEQKELARIKKDIERRKRDLGKGCCSICENRYTDQQGAHPPLCLLHPGDGGAHGGVHTFCRKCLLRESMMDHENEGFKCFTCRRLCTERVSSLMVNYDLVGDASLKRAKQDDSDSAELLALIERQKHGAKVLDALEIYSDNETVSLRCLRALNKIANARAVCAGLSVPVRRAMGLFSSQEIWAEGCKLLMFETLEEQVAKNFETVLGYMKRNQDNEVIQESACVTLNEMLVMFPQALAQILSDHSRLEELKGMVISAINSAKTSPKVRSQAARVLRDLLATAGQYQGEVDVWFSILRSTAGVREGMSELRSMCLGELWALCSQSKDLKERVLGEDGLVRIVLEGMSAKDENTQLIGLKFLRELMDRNEKTCRSIAAAEISGLEGEGNKLLSGVDVISRAVKVQTKSKEICEIGSILLGNLRVNNKENSNKRGKVDKEWDPVTVVQEAMRVHEHNKAVRAAGRWAGGLL